MTYLLIVAAIISAYLIGSFPSAYIAGRLRKGTDIRQEGSKNMGATNVFYNVGIVEGISVLLADAGKGVAAIALARYWGTPEPVQMLAGAVAVLGHIYPVFLKFRGGKGGATAIGVFSFLMPWGIPFYASIFGILMLATRYFTVSFGSAFICFPFVAWFVYHQIGLMVFSVGLILFLFIMYFSRIKEMRAKGGSWNHVAFRKGLKDRL
mgnify:FL=1